VLTVGDRFPQFNLMAVGADGQFRRIMSQDLAGQWRVFFFWPKDFTFVCPTEVMAFDEASERFTDLGCLVVGGSIDSEYVHRELCDDLGILQQKEGVALRATFLVDPGGAIRFVSVNDFSTGRSVDEVLRVLAALQSGGLTASEWQPGDPNLVAS
jgi:lipoyl-dependent peroxiredoxin subunit C